MSLGTLDKLFAKDQDKSRKGVELDVGFNEKDEPIIMVVADINHPDAEKIRRKYEKAFENSRHFPKKRQLVWARFLAESVLRDWKGVLDSDGNELKCTHERKVEALTAHEDLFSMILRFADDRDNFRPDENFDEIGSDNLPPEEDSEKNSQTA